MRKPGRRAGLLHFSYAAIVAPEPLRSFVPPELHRVHDPKACDRAVRKSVPRKRSFEVQSADWCWIAARLTARDLVFVKSGKNDYPWKDHCGWHSAQRKSHSTNICALAASRTLTHIAVSIRWACQERRSGGVSGNSLRCAPPGEHLPLAARFSWGSRTPVPCCD